MTPRSTPSRSSSDKKIGTPHSSDQKLRRAVASWSHDQLVDFAMDRIASDPELRCQVERKLTIHHNPAAAVTALNAEIDRVLDIGFIEWRQVDAYVNKLDKLLDDIRTLGETAPADALTVAWYFIEQIPGIFESVHDECELGMFCEELAEAALALTTVEQKAFQETARRLLDAFVNDEIGNFGEVPELLAKEKLTADDRTWLSQEVDRRQDLTESSYQKKQLVALSYKLLTKSKQPARRKRLQ